MVAPSQSQTQPEIIYPESDGKPMADNTKQFEWIVLIKKNLDWLFVDDANVFVAGDLLWYPVEGKPNIVNAPDVLVVFGRPKQDRGSYLQWREDNIPPQVVFEILSPSNSRVEMDRKLLFYERHGVEEYYLYAPDKNELNGWLRIEGYLDVIESIAGWVSPRLGIRFDISGEQLQIYRPDGERFLSYVEIAQRVEEVQQRAEQAEQEKQQALQQLEIERQRAEKLAEKLREMNINPEEI
jgi:Uma2 family endonuclease